MSRSQNARSERIEYIAINTVAFNNVSGGTLGRPPAAYMRVEHVIELSEHRVDHDHGSGGSDDPPGSDPPVLNERQHRQLRIRAPTHAHSLFASSRTNASTLSRISAPC